VPEVERLVTLERRGAAAYVTVERPDARNALTAAMRRRMQSIFEELAGDRDLRVAVLRGAGGIFISGADVKEFLEQRSLDALMEGAALEEELCRAVEALPAPVVAVIEGYALGGGLTLACACDLRIAARDARFGIPSAKSLGNALSPGMYARLAATIGPARVKELLICAPTLSADTAAAWGLVSEVVDPDAVDGRVAELVERLAAHAPLTMWAAKEAMRRFVHPYPDTNDVLARVLDSRDFQEGVQSFVDKRPPQWRNE
jgi:enoyl-CoA hydratase